MEADSTPATTPWHRLFVIAACWLAVATVSLLYFRSAYPDPSPFEYWIFRIVLGLVAALASGTVLRFAVGSAASRSQIALTSLTAMGVFVIAYGLVPIGFEPIPTPPDATQVNPKNPNQADVDKKPPAKEVVASYVFCTGEYERNCGFPHDYYQYCYFDPRQWGAANCKDHSVNAISSHDGNKCGYTRYEVICRKDAP
jgi:hypothetical protein